MRSFKNVERALTPPLSPYPPQLCLFHEKVCSSPIDQPHKGHRIRGRTRINTDFFPVLVRLIHVLCVLLGPFDGYFRNSNERRRPPCPHLNQCNASPTNCLGRMPPCTYYQPDSMPKGTDINTASICRIFLSLTLNISAMIKEKGCWKLAGTTSVLPSRVVCILATLPS
jgi:hypothetical protein